MQPLNPVVSSILTVLWFLVLIWAARFYSRWMLRIRSGEDRVAAARLGPVEFGLAAGMAAFLLVVVAIPGESEPASSITGQTLVNTSVFHLVVVLVLLGVLAARKVPVLEFLGLRLSGWTKAWRAGLFFVTSIALVLAAAAVAKAILGESAKVQEPVEFLINTALTGDNRLLAIGIGFTVVVAPIAEELVFRGFIYPAFKRYFGLFPAMAFSAVLFGLIHNNVAALAPLTVMAMTLAIAFEATGTILVPILMHVSFNAVNVLFMLFLVNFAPETPLPK